MTTALLGLTLAANAGVDPKVKPEPLVSGNEYVLVNKAQNANQYMSRTSWDGALYFLGEAESNYAAHSFIAIRNDDATWSFLREQDITPAPGYEVTDDGDTIFWERDIARTYLGIPGGTANVNFVVGSEIKWGVDPKDGNFYNLILGEGNNSAALAMQPFTPTRDLRLHLNAGGQYFVTTYYQGPWYPDCAGGITDDETTGDVYFQANDSTSFLWGFVPVAKIPAYMADLRVVGPINSFEATYGSLDGYQTGVAATVAAAAAIYNAPDYNEEDEDIINAMISQKVNLYKEIEAATLLNQDDDAVLAAAIANAQDTFDKTTDANSLEAAITALKQAEVNYSMGSGDMTSLGKNMSFEDLTAQDGNQS